MPKLSEKELREMRRFLRQKAVTRQRRHHKLFDAATRDAKKIIEMIIRKYQPEKIYQWGSLLNEKNFTERSDIDIALEGITNPADFFALLGNADELTAFPVDIIQLEKIHPLNAESIKKNGRLVYERSK